MTNFYPVEQELLGYTNDISLLFKKFDETGSLRFEDFCTVWKEMNFSFIHCGRKSFEDHCKGTDRLLSCVMGFFNPETAFQYRIATIYCLYGIYNTQLSDPKIKIRMTVTMWKDFKDLQNLVKKHKHHDIAFIMKKLEDDKAFTFTAMPKPLEYGNKELMTNVPSSGSELHTARQYYQPNQYVEDTVNKLDFVESIAYLEDEYLSVKDEILKSLGQEADKKALNCFKSIQEDFKTGLVDDVEQFREWMEANAHGQVLFDNTQRLAAKEIKLAETKAAPSCVTTTKSAVQKKSDTELRAEKIRALKLRSFRSVPSEGEVAESVFEPSPSEKGTEPVVVYRRGALLETREFRPWLKRLKFEPQ